MSALNWKPISSMPYDEFVFVYGGGMVWTDVRYDEGLGEFIGRTKATHWAEMDYPEE